MVATLASICYSRHPSPSGFLSLQWIIHALVYSFTHSFISVYTNSQVQFCIFDYFSRNLLASMLSSSIQFFCDQECVCTCALPTMPPTVQVTFPDVMYSFWQLDIEDWQLEVITNFFVTPPSKLFYNGLLTQWKVYLWSVLFLVVHCCLWQPCVEIGFEK